MEEQEYVHGVQDIDILQDTLTRTQQECTRLLEENRTLWRIIDNGCGLEDAISDVRKFHKKFGVNIAKSPGIPSDAEVDLRQALVMEETEELYKALDDCDLVEIADGIADSIYVLIGMALTFGIPLDDVWREVQRSNMEKVGGPIRADGKILKPEGWVPPRIKEILEQYS